MGAPLSVMRGQRRPSRKWTTLDRLLTLALQAYEDDLCGGCGQPRTYGMDDDAKDRYKAHVTVCHGCATRQRADEGEKKTPPGQYRYVVPDRGLSYAMHHPIHVNAPPPLA